MCIALFALALNPASISAWEVDLDPNQIGSPIAAPWAESEDWYVEALSNGTVLRTELIGTGVTNPFKAEIEFEEQRIHAVWKPLINSHFEEHESYEAEVAAYRLSKHLGLNMVPPTVKRKIGRRWGSLQLWVNDHRTFAKAAATRPTNFERSDQIELMRFFDAFLDNPDRNAGNYMVDDRYQVVLIDHSRAMDFEAQGPKRQASMPARFHRGAVDRLRALEFNELQELLGDIMGRSDLRGLHLSAKRLLRFVDAETETHGSAIVFETVRPAIRPLLTLTRAGASNGSTDQP